MGEFDRIKTYLAPLAGEGSLNLQDDAAISFGRVLTKDVLVEGVHFLPTDPLNLVARKALRVNQSDLIAKGCRPQSYLLGLVWPKDRPETEFAHFCEGLRAEQELTGLSLLGGDTTSGPALMISVTMFGEPVGNAPVLRSGGVPGDLLLVSGTIGDGWLGLEAARSNPPGNDRNAMPYRMPAIPFGAETVVANANAALDVSDGLIADATHLAVASGVEIRIDAARVPLSDLGRSAANGGDYMQLLTGGDDYQVLALISPEQLAQFSAPFTVIGEAMTYGGDGPRVVVADTDGKPIPLSSPHGWDHFADQ